MQKVIFFKKKKSYFIGNLFPNIKFINNIKINDIKSLDKSNKFDLSFFDSIKYKSMAAKTAAGACITTKSFEKFIPAKVEKIIVKNVLLELAHVLKKIYSNADIDYPDFTLKKAIKKKYKTVKFGNNVLVGKNVKIGNNTVIGSNTIIEKNVIIGKNCIIGSGNIIKNTLLGDRVVTQDNCKIGQKGFGFIPIKGKNIKFPHVGKVRIANDVEIASGCTIDRGSVDDTKIRKNTKLLNLVIMF